MKTNITLLFVICSLVCAASASRCRLSAPVYFQSLSSSYRNVLSSNCIRDLVDCRFKVGRHSLEFKKKSSPGDPRSRVFQAILLLSTPWTLPLQVASSSRRDQPPIILPIPLVQVSRWNGVDGFFLLSISWSRYLMRTSMQAIDENNLILIKPHLGAPLTRATLRASSGKVYSQSTGLTTFRSVEKLI